MHVSFRQDVLRNLQKLKKKKKASKKKINSKQDKDFCKSAMDASEYWIQTRDRSLITMDDSFLLALAVELPPVLPLRVVIIYSRGKKEQQIVKRLPLGQQVNHMDGMS